MSQSESDGNLPFADLPLIDTLQTINRLPSARLRRRASRQALIRDRLAMPLDPSQGRRDGDKDKPN